MEDAKGWMDQWFKGIRSWCPNDLDVERTIWLRIYGVPSDALNESFFTQLVKPWGSFINKDEGALKKITMDVARLMIRTSCQKITDEFVDVKVNGDIYHLCVLEDSYGPMRIMIPQKNGNEGRDSSVESEEDEEEEVRRMWTEGDIEEREFEEDGAGGPQHTSNNNLSITGDVVRNETQSAELTKTDPIGIQTKDTKGKGMTRIHPTPAKLRKQQHPIQHMNLKIPNPDLSLSSFRANPAEDEASSCHSVSEFNGVTRKPPLKHRSGRKPTSSLSSVGEILCCSSSSFRNCNRRFMEKYFKNQLISYGRERRGETTSTELVITLRGDFNAISKSGERRGSSGSGCLSERSEFSLFIEAMEVIDIPVLGKKFTWFNSNGSTMRRLDRFLLSEGFIHKGGISNQWIGDHDISDHCPIWLECSILNWGPKPFKFNNCWVNHPEFLDLVKNIWVQSNVRGTKTFVISEKMKRLKEALKKWNRGVFGFKDLSIDKTVRELNEVEDLIANAPFDEAEVKGTVWSCDGNKSPGPKGFNLNFFKSKLYGINVGARLLEAGATFLACNTATIPFKFLGIPVGANPRRRETWKPVVEAMTKRLHSWHSRHLAPCCVLKSIEKIQRNFLWGGGAEERKICWAKWDQICLPKVKGGLGVKNLEFFNLALLRKWKWRFLNHDNAIWADLLRYRYGHLPSLLLSGLDITSIAHSSLWWRDIISPERGMSDSWFKSNISCRVGNGNNIGFWQFKLYGNQAFYDLFPDLYAKEAIKNIMVSERLHGTGSVSLWRWNWSESLSENEAQQLTAVQGLFDGFSLHNNNHDQWRWSPDSNGLFTVKSSYTNLLDLRQVELQDAHALEAIFNAYGSRMFLRK
ncbi:hypothetical protein TSUD_296890 [Trifolium subterraneum]|uniref:DUF4283 domain-containing protein n=1 Tax=Trifolium subterraneum TaxID=3900 RepID=A0A2Z6NEZ6_TRISU|nr:hypothetical protein TSUD_296890 [Trifolium subterraneum]